MRVRELCGGDVINHAGHSALFVGASTHPTYDNFALVVWKMLDEDEGWSFDALDWDQEVGFLSSYRNDNVAKLASVLG